MMHNGQKQRISVGMPFMGIQQASTMDRGEGGPYGTGHDRQYVWIWMSIKGIPTKEGYYDDSH